MFFRNRYKFGPTTRRSGRPQLGASEREHWRLITMRILIAIALLICSAASHACQCATSPLAKRVELSSGVFVGEVVAYTPLQSVQLKLVERFKGKEPQIVSIVTGQSDCDYFLPPVALHSGDRFLVFLTKGSLGNTVSRCLGSTPAALTPEMVPESNVFLIRRKWQWHNDFEN